MKIALMTWHHAANYGTAYQAYALKTIIEEQGCKVDLIDYRRLSNSPLHKISILDYFYGLIRHATHLTKKNMSYTIKKKVFEDFYNNKFTYTPNCLSNQDFQCLNDIYDGFVCGSDQIWGPEWFDPRYFLDFVIEIDKLIAYAPSLGVDAIDDLSLRDEYFDLVNRFSHVSVRERTGCELLKKICKREDIVNVLDPVLMLDMQRWGHVEEPINVEHKKYSLIFFLKNDENIRQSIENARLRNLQPIIMHCTQSEDNKFANIGDVTPGQLLSLIKGASYIYTDSFHVTVLSILYHKEFKVFGKKHSKAATSKNSRLTDLLKQLNLDNKIFEDPNYYAENFEYPEMDKRLNILREESYRYLCDAINNIRILAKERNATNDTCEHQRYNCIGEQSTALLKRLKRCSADRYLDIMKQFPFSLENKCYRCKYYDIQYKKSGNRKPLFYRALQRDLNNTKISTFKIFVDYYFPYYLSTIIKRLTK